MVNKLLYFIWFNLFYTSDLIETCRLICKRELTGTNIAFTLLLGRRFYAKWLTGRRHNKQIFILWIHLITDMHRILVWHQFAVYLLSTFADCDAELSVRPAQLCGKEPVDPGAWRKPGVLSQSVDTPPNSEQLELYKHENHTLQWLYSQLWSNLCLLRP